MKPTFRFQDPEASPHSSCSPISPLSTMTALTPLSPFTFLYYQNLPSIPSFSFVAEIEAKKADDLNLPTCRCKRSKCLKLYCDCFARQKDCSSECQCQGCHNTEEYKEERDEVIIKTKAKNPAAFRADISSNYKICHCSKSNCLKKYCECFQKGRKCGLNCRCKQCQNISDDKDLTC